MIWQIIFFIVILFSFVLQIYLSSKKSRWLGVIVPVVFFIAASVFLVLNLSDAFSAIEGYGFFLIAYGSAGFFALILKIGFIYTPVLIQLVIYFICRHYYKKKKPPCQGQQRVQENDC